MSVRGKFYAVLLIAVLALALPGCSGVAAKVDYTFEAGGPFLQTVDVRGVALDDDQVSGLKSGGWKVKQGASGFTATCQFASAAAYAKPAGTLYGTLQDAFVRDAGYDPGMNTEVTVLHEVTDYVVATRHDVEITLPPLEFSPTECPTCDGTGSSDCPDCDGGTQTCSACDGTGGYNGWYGWENCWSCGGSGKVKCSTCDGSGTVTCDDCGGTGDAPEWIKTAYDESVSASKLDVALNMPGITVKNTSTENSPWRLKGADIETADTFAATSYVVNWLYAGVAVAVLLIILALIVWLVVRRIKKAFVKRPPVVVATVPVVGPTPTGLCAGCGAPFVAGAKFCRSCGSPTGSGGA